MNVRICWCFEGLFVLFPFRTALSLKMANLPSPPLAHPPKGKEGGGREVRIGQAGGGRARGGERPMGTAAYRGRGFKGRAGVSGGRPIRRRLLPKTAQPGGMPNAPSPAGAPLPPASHSGSSWADSGYPHNPSLLFLRKQSRQSHKAVSSGGKTITHSPRSGVSGSAVWDQGMCGAMQIPEILMSVSIVSVSKVCVPCLPLHKIFTGACLGSISGVRLACPHVCLKPSACHFLSPVRFLAQPQQSKHH